MRILAVLTFLLALGHIAILWTWQARLPILNQFTHPVKFLPFFHLFSCGIGALFVDRAIQQTSGVNRWQCLTFIVVAALLLYHAFWARSALFLYADPPYPILPKQLEGLKGDPSH